MLKSASAYARSRGTLFSTTLLAMSLCLASNAMAQATGGRGATTTPASPRRALARGANDTVAYLYLKGKDTVAVERIIRKPDAVRGILIVRAQPTLVWTQHLGKTNSGGDFDMDVYPATATADALPQQSLTLRIVDDSGFFDIHANGATNTVQRLKLQPGVEWMLNSSVLHTDVLTQLARKRGQENLTVALVQGGQMLPLVVHAAGDTTVVNIAGKDARFIYDLKGMREAWVGLDTRVVRAEPADAKKLTAKTAAEKF